MPDNARSRARGRGLVRSGLDRLDPETRRWAIVLLALIVGGVIISAVLLATGISSLPKFGGSPGAPSTDMVPVAPPPDYPGQGNPPGEAPVCHAGYICAPAATSAADAASPATVPATDPAVPAPTTTAVPAVPPAPLTPPSAGNGVPPAAPPAVATPAP